MKVEIISVGTELLLGDILNTNAKYLSERLAMLGFNLYSQSVVGDNALRLEEQIKLSLSRSEIIILTGGLGPTPDDITKETVAKALELNLEMDKASLKSIEEYFKRTGRVMSENNQKQALTIKGAEILPNKNGTAPGYAVKTKNGLVILLPGPPAELMPMFENSVEPLLLKYSNQTIVSHNIKLFGVGESAAAEALGELLNGVNPTVATYAKTGEVDVRVTTAARNSIEADLLSEPVLEEIENVFGENIYAVDYDNLQAKVVDLLIKNNKKLATAESCTAGMLSSRITEIPGSSKVFEMGVTAYANYIKVYALGVNAEVIKEKGAVSAEVAIGMAKGIRNMCNADIGLGITGVAGPGESEGKPAGLVYVALADRQKVFVRKIMSRGSNREATRILATSTALDMARRYIEGCAEFLSQGTLFDDPINVMETYPLPKAYVKPLVLTKEISEETYNIDNADLNTKDYTIKAETQNSENTVAEDCIFEEETQNFVFDDEYSIENILSEEEEKIATPKEHKKSGFFSKIFPTKSDPISEKIRKIIFIFALVVLIGTMGYIVNYFVEGWLQTKIIKEAAQIWENDESFEKNDQGVFVGFETLMAKNSDIKGWVSIEGTKINNPVYQAKDNDYYIKHNMNKEISRYGAVFVDSKATVLKYTTSKNLVLYGHHMRDGTMFAPLKNYLNLDFYKKHSLIDFNTLYRNGKYKVFAVFITNVNPEQDNGNVFNYTRSDFDTAEEFLSWINEAKQRSIIDTGVEVFETDKILTLSTCTYEFDNARLVVMARRVRNADVNVEDVSLAKLNPNPMYPEIWYTKKGLVKPDFSSNVEIQENTTDEIEPSLDVVTSEETVTNSSSNSIWTGNTNTSKPASTSSKTASPSSKTEATSSKSAVSSSKPAVSSSKPAVSSSKPVSSSNKPVVSSAVQTHSEISSKPQTDTTNSVE